MRKYCYIALTTILIIMSMTNLVFAVETSKQSDTMITIDWALFPRVYSKNTTVFVPAKFTIKTSNPEKMALKPLIITDQTSEVKIPINTPKIKLEKNEESIIKFIPFEVGETTRQAKMNLVFIDNNGIIYEHVENKSPNIDVFIVDIWVIIALIMINVFIIAFYKQYIIRFFKLEENKKAQAGINLIMAIEMFLFSYLFMAPWNITLSIALILIAFLFSNAKSRLFMPFVFGLQLLMLESYIDLIFNVSDSAIIISFSAIVMVSTVLFLITFLLRKTGIVLSMIASLIGVLYYVAQLYYQSFFQDFFPIASLYKVNVAGELSSSIFSLTTTDEIMIFLLLILNIVVFWLYRIYSKTERKAEEEKRLLLLAESSEDDILEKRQIKYGFARITNKWAEVEGFHKM